MQMNDRDICNAFKRPNTYTPFSSRHLGQVTKPNLVRKAGLESPTPRLSPLTNNPHDAESRLGAKYVVISRSAR